MPRRARESLSTSFFHVIVQGLNKEYIFEKDVFKDKYFKLLKNVYNKYELDIIAYVIMSNHAHLLIHSEMIQNLSRFMKEVNEGYARYYNYKSNRTGYVFKNRYLSEAITNQRYLLNCMVYIHNNPVKANLVKKCEDYKYSSYNDYLSKTGFINDEIIKLVFESSKVDISDFKKLHKGIKYFFMENIDMIQDNMAEIIKEFESRYCKSWKEIISKPENIERIIIEIKQSMRIPNSRLCKYLKVNRSTVDRILRKNC